MDTSTLQTTATTQSLVTIQIDTSQLSYPDFLIPGVTPDFLNGAMSPSITLVPGTYGFQQASGYFADFTFTVDATGNVSFDIQFADFLSGAGTPKLVVAGFPIRLVATALDHDLLPLVAGADILSHATVHDLRLVPASHYGFVPASGIVATFEFRVDLNGQVSVDTAFSSFASASGNTLTIAGHTINVDGRGLSHDLLPVSLLGYTRGFLPRTSVNQLTLIPAAGYDFQPGSGIVAEMSYTVGLDGMVSYPASCDGFLSGSGTNTLVVGGYAILIDATKADSDLLSLVSIGLAAQTSRFLFAVLIPANGYAPQTANGVFSSGFAVHQDGSITFPPNATGHYVLSTVPRLEIEGATPF